MMKYSILLLLCLNLTVQGADLVQKEIAHRFFDMKIVQSLQAGAVSKVMLMASQLCSSTDHIAKLVSLHKQNKTQVSVLVTRDVACGSDKQRFVREYSKLPVRVLPEDDCGVKVTLDAVQQALKYEQLQNKLPFLLALIMTHTDAYLVYVDQQGQEIWTHGARENYAEIEHALQFRLEHNQTQTDKN